MSRNIKLIFNPAAQGGNSKKIATKVQGYLQERGIDYELVETVAPLHAIQLAKDAKDEGFDVVASIGGDGTAHEVANGAIQAGATFGLIPAGSGNDFSKGIGLTGSWEQAIDTIINGREESISVVKSGDRYSINVFDIGLGAKTVEYSQNHLKWMTGSKKYTLLMVRALLGHKTSPTKVIVDGEEFDFNVNILAAGFGQSFGSGMLILPSARFTDDKLTMGIVTDAGRLKILRIFPKVFSGKHVNMTKYWHEFKADKVEIIPKNPDRLMPIEAEGEYLGEGQVNFEAVPNGMKVMIPKDWDLANQSLWA